MFVCSHNKWRSLTAEKIYEKSERYEVRSAGTDPGARIRVTAGHIGWADVIFVMEKKHSQLLQSKYSDLLNRKKMICLHISDSYEFMDAELIDLLRMRLSEYIEIPADD